MSTGFITQLNFGISALWDYAVSNHLQTDVVEEVQNQHVDSFHSRNHHLFFSFPAKCSPILLPLRTLKFTHMHHSHFFWLERLVDPKARCVQRCSLITVWCQKMMKRKLCCTPSSWLLAQLTNKKPCCTPIPAYKQETKIRNRIQLLNLSFRLPFIFYIKVLKPLVTFMDPWLTRVL